MKNILIICAVAFGMNATAASDIQLRINTPGRFIVMIGEQSLRVSNGMARFSRIPAGRTDVSIVQNNTLVYREIINVRDNARISAEWLGGRIELREIQPLNNRFHEDVPVTAPRSPYDGLESCEPRPLQEDRFDRRDRRRDNFISNNGMSRRDFERFRWALDRESYHNKLRFFERNIARTPVSSQQLSVLLYAFSFENDRLAAAKIGWNSVTDPEEFYQVYSALDSRASVEDLRRYTRWR